MSLVREGFETTEKGLEIEVRGIEAAEETSNDTVSFGGLAQLVRLPELKHLILVIFLFYFSLIGSFLCVRREEKRGEISMQGSLVR